MATIGGKEVEVFSEAFFCIYFALHLKGKLKKYKSNEWTKLKTASSIKLWAQKKGIASIVQHQLTDPEFVARIKLIPTFLVDKDWDARLRKQIDKFFTTIPIGSVGKSYWAMRADVMPVDIDPYKVFEKLSVKLKSRYDFRNAVDKDKWNPGDVWIFSSTARKELTTKLRAYKQAASSNEIYSAGAVTSLNSLVRGLYDTADLYPISLKAPGAAVRISLENDKVGGYHKVLRFIKVDLDATNQDCKIFFAIDLYNTKTKSIYKKDIVKGRIKSKTDRGGFRLEIEVPGSGARYGSIATENYQWIISNTDKSGVDKLNRIRKSYDDPAKMFPVGGERTWLGASNYQKAFKKSASNIAYLDDYFTEIYSLINKTKFKSKDAREKLNKIVASEIAIAINFIKSTIMKDITVENLYNLSASQSFAAGISPQQLERYKKTADKDEIQALSKKEFKLLMDSCFHLKVY